MEAPGPELSTGSSFLAYSASGPGSWAVYAIWPLIAVVLATVVVRHRDV
ncbi:hypothetical protein ACFCXP_15000 [Streptomyces niveus]